MKTTGFKYACLLMALVWMGAPLSASADADFGELVVAGEVSPEERLDKKLDLTRGALSKAIEKAEGMKISLEALELGEGSVELTLRNDHLNDVSSYTSFYKEKGLALDNITVLEEVDLLIQEIIEYRESIYAPSAKNVLEFILVFSYSPEILNTAKERLASIKIDIEKLEGLELMETGQFTELLEQSEIILKDAETFQERARTMLLEPYQATSTVEIITEEIIVDEAPENETVVEVETASAEEALDTPPDLILLELNARESAEESLNKIKGLYVIFMETGQKVKEALGI